MIETLDVEAKIQIQIRRYQNFAGIKINIPKEIQHWVFRLGGESKETEGWIVPIDVLEKKANKNFSRLLERADQIKKHHHNVFTKNFLKKYRTGETFRSINYDDMIEDVDVLSLTEKQLQRAFHFGKDHWLRRLGQLEPRDIQVQAWTTLYGPPDKIKAQVQKNSRFQGINISPNTVWQNHDISGEQDVWIRMRLSDEELKIFLNKTSYESTLYLLEELFGLEQINTEN